MGIKQTLVSFMKEPAYSPMALEDLVAVFDIKPNEYSAFKKTLRVMEREGLIMRTKKDRFIIADGNNNHIETKENLVIGTLQAHAKGFGFLIPEDENEKDVFLPSNCMNGAINGDKIAVKVTREDTNTKKREGEVVEILERNTTTVVGIYEDSKSFGFVISEDTRISRDIYIPKRDRNGAQDGDVVTVEIDESEYKGRRDLRDVRMVTIDGEDAKDLDDAVSIEKLPNGNYKLGVHIADVSHYVRENNPLDKEAFKRATSVYLIDRVIPMLRRKLSNGICSLNPKVDRLTLSCIMEIDHKGKVVNHEIVESVIRTNERMTYTDVTKILEDNDEELIKRYDYLVDDFKTMKELCKILRAKRTKRGAIDFEIAEAKIILNELGKPIEIKPYDRAISNRMIEEFMLVANETVAEHMFWTHLPFVYRIHENPDDEKLTKFKEFIHNLGYNINWTEEIRPKTLQDIIEKVKGKSEETVVNTLLLRSMMQARYAPECTGHFGLAAQYYCHFTSPIRRYPDLQIHRIIKEYLHGKIDEKRENKLKNIVGHSAKQSSEMERKAQDAEREVDDLKKAEYMQDRIGEEFEGVISSVTSFGVFVELPSTIEGLVHITDLDDDYYIYEEDHLRLIGERTKKIYKLGDKVLVECVHVDMPNKEIFFKIIEEPNEEEVSVEEPKNNESEIEIK